MYIHTYTYVYMYLASYNIQVRKYEISEKKKHVEDYHPVRKPSPSKLLAIFRNPDSLVLDEGFPVW